MRVHIEKDIYLSADGRQYTLERRTVTQSGDNAGTEHYTAFKYYVSLQGAIDGLIKLKLSESTVTTLKELMESVERMKEDILAVVGK